jgi:hypothetical protein
MKLIKRIIFIVGFSAVSFLANASDISTGVKFTKENPVGTVEVQSERFPVYQKTLVVNVGNQNGTNYVYNTQYQTECPDEMKISKDLLDKAISLLPKDTEYSVFHFYRQSMNSNKIEEGCMLSVNQANTVSIVDGELHKVLFTGKPLYFASEGGETFVANANVTQNVREVMEQTMSNIALPKNNGEGNLPLGKATFPNITELKPISISNELLVAKGILPNVKEFGPLRVMMGLEDCETISASKRTAELAKEANDGGPISETSLYVAEQDGKVMDYGCYALVDGNKSVYLLPNGADKGFLVQFTK